MSESEWEINTWVPVGVAANGLYLASRMLTARGIMDILNSKPPQGPFRTRRVFNSIYVLCEDARKRGYRITRDNGYHLESVDRYICDLIRDDWARQGIVLLTDHHVNIIRQVRVKISTKAFAC